MEALTGEINHRYFAGLLAIMVVLLHLRLVLLLMQPSDTEKKIAPQQIMEVALLVQPKPKTEVIKPPEPPKPTPKKPAAQKPVPKKPTPPKPVPKPKETKPPAAKKEPIKQKIGDIAQPKSVSKETFTPPPVLTNPFAKTEAPVSKPQAQIAAAKKPAVKSGSGDGSNKGGSSGVVPLVRVQPIYPMRATSRHIEGWVKIEFTVTAAGSVSNPVVVGASPPGIFDEAALDAIRKWKFKQKIVDGSPVAQRAVQVLKFKLMK